MSPPTDLPPDGVPDELRALRERAYGRDADIQDDPVALARLHELEAQASTAGAAAVALDVPPTAPRDGAEERRDAATAADSDASGPPDPAATSAAPASADAGAAIPADAPASPVPVVAPRGPWWRRRTPLLWAGSVVAGVLLGVAATLAVQTLDTGRIATLQVDEDADWPESFFGERPEGGRVFEDFHGLRVLVFEQASNETGSQNCLYILVTPDSFGGGSCASGVFAAVASVQVVPRSPEALRDRFPAGTSLQFVLDGSEVRVYAREPALIDPTP